MFSGASRCLNCQLGTQRMMGVRGKAVSRQAHPARVRVPPPKGKRKKLSCLSVARGACTFARVLFCFDALVLWVGLDWTTQAMGQQHTSPLRAGSPGFSLLTIFLLQPFLFHKGPFCTPLRLLC